MAISVGGFVQYYDKDIDYRAMYSLLQGIHTKLLRYAIVDQGCTSNVYNIHISMSYEDLSVDGDDLAILTSALFMYDKYIACNVIITGGGIAHHALMVFNPVGKTFTYFDASYSQAFDDNTIQTLYDTISTATSYSPKPISHVVSFQEMTGDYICAMWSNYMLYHLCTGGKSMDTTVGALKYNRSADEIQYSGTVREHALMVERFNMELKGFIKYLYDQAKNIYTDVDLGEDGIKRMSLLDEAKHIEDIIIDINCGEYIDETDIQPICEPEPLSTMHKALVKGKFLKVNTSPIRSVHSPSIRGTLCGIVQIMSGVIDDGGKYTTITRIINAVSALYGLKCTRKNISSTDKAIFIEACESVNALFDHGYDANCIVSAIMINFTSDVTTIYKYLTPLIPLINTNSDEYSYHMEQFEDKYMAMTGIHNVLMVKFVYRYFIRFILYNGINLYGKTDYGLLYEKEYIDILRERIEKIRTLVVSTLTKAKLPPTAYSIMKNLLTRILIYQPIERMNVPVLLDELFFKNKKFRDNLAYAIKKASIGQYYGDTYITKYTSYIFSLMDMLNKIYKSPVGADDIVDTFILRPSPGMEDELWALVSIVETNAVMSSLGLMGK